MKWLAMAVLVLACASACADDADDDDSTGDAGTGGTNSAGSGGTSAGGTSNEPEEFPTGFGAPEDFVSNLTRPVRVGIHADYVYFTEMGLDDGSASRLARADAGGNVETLFDGVTVTTLHLDEEELFFVERGTGSLFRMSYETLEPVLFATTPRHVADVERLGDTLWITEYEDTGTTTIVTQSRLGGPRTEIVAPVNPGFLFTYLAVGGNKLYAATLSTSPPSAGGLFKIDGTSGALSVPDVSANHIAADQSYVYFGSRDDGQVLKQAHDRTMSPELLATGQARPFAVTVDGGGVYWTNEGECGVGVTEQLGSVRAAALSGGDPVLVASEESCPQAIVTNAEFVYWLVDDPADVLGDAAIRRAPKLR
jgi:hypothetical protein